jgi:spore germination protein GerM
MLEAYQITSEQCAASLCYTFCTFLPNISGVDISINGTPVDSLYLTEDVADDSSDALLRAECSDRLYDYCTLYFATEDQKTLAAVKRPISYFQRTNPRSLLVELAKGPQASDSRTDLLPVMSKDVLKNTDMLGFALSDSTMLVNFSPSFSKAANELTAIEERLFAYSLVNTLCMEERIKNVCFFQAGNQFDGFSGEIYWAGLFYPMAAQ